MRAGMMGNHHNEYVFEVELLAVVRVRATSESGAREVIPAALEALGADVIGLLMKPILSRAKTQS